jgi:hypothetical protein
MNTGETALRPGITSESDATTVEQAREVVRRLEASTFDLRWKLDHNPGEDVRNLFESKLASAEKELGEARLALGEMEERETRTKMQRTQSPRPSASDIEAEIGRRERLHDLVRDRVVGLEASLAAMRARGTVPFAPKYDPGGIAISKMESELAAAREALIEAEQKMREGHGWRTKSASGE